MIYISYSKEELIKLVNNYSSIVQLFPNEEIVDIVVDKDSFVRFQIKDKNDKSNSNRSKRKD